MLIKLAWRNIWRSKLRSAVVIGSVVVGIWSIIFLVSMVFGMVDSYINNAIDNEVSHIQITNPAFNEDQEIQYTIKNLTEVVKSIKKIDQIKSINARCETNAMIATGRSTKGVKLIAIDHESELSSWGIPKKVMEGKFYESEKRNKILISKSLTEKLHAKMKSKVILTFQDKSINMISNAYRINGVFKTDNKMFDEANVFVSRKEFSSLVGMDNEAHKILIKVDDLDQVDTIQAQLKSMFPDLSIKNYEEVSPELALFKNQIGMASTIYIFIFMLALIFGIINTMLMAVLERFKELGMLMSIGMNRLKIFKMIILETLILALIGLPIGLGIGYLMTSYFNKTGIDLFFYSEEGMAQFGMSKFIYPSVDPDTYLQLGIAVVITALLASIYPAIKAIRIKPIEALHKL